MNKKYLFILGAAAMMASCSNNEVVDQKEDVNIPFDGKIEMSASSNISITQSRAVVNKWNNTPIRVWGLDKNGTGWNTANGNLFSPSNYVNGTVDSEGKVQLGAEGDVFFYPLNSDVNFSFYSCSPLPNSPSLSSNSATVTYDITGNTDILWGEAIAEDVIAGGVTYSGYNARYFRKGGTTPTLKFKHLLTQLQLKGIGGSEGYTENGTVWPVSIKDIKVVSPAKASMIVAGSGKGTLAASAADTDIPVYFGDDPYSTKINIEEGVEKDAGTVMILPTAGSYTLKVTLAAMVNGVEKTQENDVTITYKGKDGNEAPFEEGKAYKVRLTIYGLRLVTFDPPILEPWQDADVTIDQEVN